jgi:hypothetical protein
MARAKEIAPPVDGPLAVERRMLFYPMFTRDSSSGDHGMPDDNHDFTDSALLGHLVSARLLAKLVDREVISPGDALDVLDDVLLQLEEWQALFPELSAYFESARKFLSESIAGYRAMPRRPSD